MLIIILFAIVVLTTGQNVSSKIAENQESVTHSENKVNNQSSEMEKVLILDKETQSKMKNSLLTMFGMKKRPKPIDRTKIIIPDAMKSLFSEIVSKESSESVHLPKPGLLTDSANTVRSFVHEESEIDNRFVNQHRFRLYFNVSKIPKEEILRAADLELQRTPILEGTIVRHTVQVYDIIRPGIKGKTEPMLYLMDTKTVYINSSETVNLDVAPAVERWLEKPKRNYGVLIHIIVDRRTEQIPQQHIRLKRNAERKLDNWAKEQPILMTYTDDGRYKQRMMQIMMNSPSRRTSNRASNKRRNGTRQLCQRKTLYVDFSTVGWGDWIVAPRGYDAFYCQGECNLPFADHINSTNHAVVQAMVNSINNDVAPKACCIPTELKPISILYLDDHNKVVLKSYKDMQVVGCGCR